MINEITYSIIYRVSKMEIICPIRSQYNEQKVIFHVERVGYDSYNNKVHFIEDAGRYEKSFGDLDPNYIESLEKNTHKFLSENFKIL
jgi:hypothetical protein